MEEDPPQPPLEEATANSHVDVSNRGGTENTSVQRSSRRMVSSFEHRRGEAFRWSSVNYTAVKRKGFIPGTGELESKDILTNVWGEALPGETTAIMGPSGAGKTSLIQALTGRIALTGQSHVSGDISLGEDRLDARNRQAIRQRIAFVPQQDELFYSDTPRDAIRFSARLRLPKSLTYQEIDELVDHYIDRLGLQRCADHLIGGPFFMKQRISGGERRRTSIGIELVTTPKTIILDEPTSGLDSYASLQVMELLRQISDAGNTVVFTIHQPSSRIFLQFDKVVLLRAGKLVYMGSTQSTSESFADKGLPCPREINPADWILEVAQDHSEEELTEKGFFPKQPEESDVKRQESGEGGENSPNRTNDEAMISESTAGIFRQTSLLIQREFLSVVRVPFLFQVTVFLTLTVAFLSGALFFKIGQRDREEDYRLVASVLQAQLGSVVNAYLVEMSLPGGPALLYFTELRPLFVREHSTGHYGILAFLLGYIIPEAVKTAITLVLQTTVIYFMVQYHQSFWELLSVSFLAMHNGMALAAAVGSSLADVKLAMAVYPVVLLTQVYFSGIFVPINLMPDWISWMQYVCSLRFAVNIGASYEFSDCKPGVDSLLCEQFLELNEVNVSQRGIDWMSLALLYLGFRIATYFLFRQAIARET